MLPGTWYLVLVLVLGTVITFARGSKVSVSGMSKFVMTTWNTHGTRETMSRKSIQYSVFCSIFMVIIIFYRPAFRMNQLEFTESVDYQVTAYQYWLLAWFVVLRWLHGSYVIRPHITPYSLWYMYDTTLSAFAPESWHSTFFRGNMKWLR